MTSSSALKIKPLSIDRLQPNCWNPNQMSDAEFRALVDEVHRLGRLPKPIVVRRQNDAYQIIDGEHNWRAAQEAGLREIACEILDADDYEAMRQTFKRNQHGTHSPVLEGRMFGRMVEERQTSQRELAQALGVSEGTVRNRLRYADAADLRNRYAGENRDAEIDGLQTRQVRAYIELPQTVADRWLDAGGELGQLGQYKDHDLVHLGRLLDQYKLVEYLDPQDFRESFRRIAQLAEWLYHHQHVPGIIDYARPIAELRLPTLVASVIPIGQGQTDRTIYLGLDDWLEIVNRQYGHTTPEDLVVEIGSVVFERLEDLGVDTRLVFNAVLGGSFATLLELPEYIREAHHLTVEEQVQLHFATAPGPPDVINRAKHETIDALRETRQTSEGSSGNGHSDPGYVLGIFLTKVRSLLDSEGQAIEPRCFDREELLRSFDSIFDWCPQLRNASVARRPVLDVFRDRIATLETPELVAMHALFHSAVPAVALGEWMDAIDAEFIDQDQPSPGTVD